LSIDKKKILNKKRHRSRLKFECRRGFEWIGYTGRELS